MSFLPNFSKIIDSLLKINIELNINSKNNFTVTNKPSLQLNEVKSKKAQKIIESSGFTGRVEH